MEIQKGSDKMKISEKTLTRLWGQIIMKRDGYKCRVCSRIDSKNPHHIFTRSRKSTKFLLENGINLCYSHHAGSAQMSAHKTPRDFERWLLRQVFTDKQYNDLELTSRLTQKFDAEAVKIYLDREAMKYFTEKEYQDLLIKLKIKSSNAGKLNA